MIVLGLGSNLGDRAANLRRAVRLLHAEPAVTVRRVSPLYESEAMLLPGASADWRELLKRKTGSDLSAKAMVDYFEPLRKWLVKQNEGRKCTLADV